MPTKKPRVTFTVSQGTLDQIDEYRLNSAAKNQTKAILDLLKRGLQDYEGERLRSGSTHTERSGQRRPAKLYSQAALQLAKDYDHRMDNWGRETVRAVADKEIARCEDDARFLKETEEPKEPKVITLYSEPSAAGIPSPVEGRDYCFIELGPDDPQGAAYAVQLQGDSMEPDFPDGSIVYVNHDALADGDIGIFSVDGGTVCKQYHKDALGMVYLFSLNRKRKDADIVIPPSSNSTLVCQGRVITKRHYPLPGR